MKQIKIIVFLAVLLMFLVSCVSNRNSHYFYLAALKSTNQSDLVKHYKQSIKKDNDFAAALSQQALLNLYYDRGEYDEIQKIIALAKNNPYISSDIVTRFELASNIKTQQENSIFGISKWLQQENFTTFHKDFFTSEEYSEFKSAHIQNKNPVYEKTIMLASFKNALYDRQYQKAVQIITPLLADKQDAVFNTLFLEKEAWFLSDLGKALLYGSKNYEKNALFFQNAAKTYPVKSDEAFMCNFYAGRIFYAAGQVFYEKSSQALVQAFTNTDNLKLFDNALWYYFSNIQKQSNRVAIQALIQYASQWHNQEYFDDFLEKLSHGLLKDKNYKGFYGLYTFIKPYASGKSFSKLAYITARLLEIGLLSEADRDVKVHQAYMEAIQTKNANWYYKLLAAERLDIAFTEIIPPQELQKQQNDKNIEKLLLALIDNNLEDKVYPLFLEYSHAISTKTSLLLAQALADMTDVYYSQSLRIAVNAFNKADSQFSAEDFKLLYPRFYESLVAQYAQQNDLDMSTLFALIRSESFFNKNAQSWAGALGLCQILDTTAQDIARKLKITDYNILNPEINIQFGSFYLNELTKRLNGSQLLALFSYNAGITKVRRWANQHTGLSNDLFLELIPYTETREYGRKILSAAAFYAILYYDKKPHDVVKALMY